MQGQAWRKSYLSFERVMLQDVVRPLPSRPDMVTKGKITKLQDCVALVASDVQLLHSCWHFVEEIHKGLHQGTLHVLESLLSLYASLTFCIAFKLPRMPVC